MTCAACGSTQGFSEGRCRACGKAPTAPAAAAPQVRCPKCRTGVEAGEKFCAKCGAKIPTRADRIRAMNRKKERQENQQHVHRGRRWMLIVAVITLFGAVFSYFNGMSEVDKQVREAKEAFQGMTAAERDAQLKVTIGMTWEEAVDHDRGLVTFQTAIFGTLGIVYVGLWWWSQKNPFAAALTALLLFITTMLVSAMVDPTSLLKGILMKAFVVIALFSAVSAGHRERAMTRRRA